MKVTDLRIEIGNRLPDGFKKYRNDSFLIRHKENDLDVMLSIGKNMSGQYHSVIYLYVKNGTKMACSPLIFFGDENETIQFVSDSIPLLSIKKLSDVKDVIRLLPDSIKSKIVTISFT